MLTTYLHHLKPEIKFVLLRRTTVYLQCSRKRLRNPMGKAVRADSIGFRYL